MFVCSAVQLEETYSDSCDSLIASADAPPKPRRSKRAKAYTYKSRIRKRDTTSERVAQSDSSSDDDELKSLLATKPYKRLRAT